MGDLVLTGEEVPKVVSALLKGGIEVSAIHNHLLRSTPATYYVHIDGKSDPVALAITIRAALAASKTPMGPSPAPAKGAPTVTGFDTAALITAMGYHGKANGGVYQFSIPRADVTREGGMAIPPAMGMA